MGAWSTAKSQAKRGLTWLLTLFRGDIVVVTYYPDLETRTFSRNVYFSGMGAKQARALGYARGYKILDEWRFLPFKTYVKFAGAESPAFPTETFSMDGNPHATMETSSTLYDRFRTKSTEKFVKGMTKTSMTSGDQRRMIMIGVVALVAAAGMALIFLRRNNGANS